MNRVKKNILIFAFVGLLAFAAFPGTAAAQGSRKDDIVFNAPGRYEIEISGPGITTKQLPNVILPSDPSTPTFTTVTTTSGISAFSLSLSGNLTVSGSTAVTGALTVGGVPIATTASDNQWISPQRFKGPIPYRDFSAYMPSGGCSSNNTNDPPATGTITGGTNTLTVSNAADFKNGCGIAVIGAGPAATLAMATTASGTATRSGTLVTFTVTSGDPHLVPGVGSGSDFVGGVSVSGCSDTNFNTTTTGWLLNYGIPVTSFTYNTSGSGGVSATGCTATFYEGWAHGTTGSTTWNYKIAAIDAYGGLSAAIGPITITNGNATLSPQNYNWVGWQGTVGAREFAVYRDDGMGGPYSCVNIAYGMGYSDWGRALPYGCPAYVPATPPGSPTAETLNTTIGAGGGTTTLTLAANASNTATTQNVYDDVSMFLASCINDVITDQANASISRFAGTEGCYVPYGRWPINGDMPTDTISAGSSGGVNLRVAGTMLFQSWPWLIGSEYTIKGAAQSCGAMNGLNFSCTLIERGIHMPSGVVIRGTNVEFDNFGVVNMMGHALELTIDPSNFAATAGVQLNNLALNVQNGYGIGVPLLVDGNTLFLWGHNLNFIPRSDGFPASMLFTELNYGGNGHAEIHFSNIYTQWHHIVIDSPGGQNSGQGTSFSINGSWSSEEHGQYPTGGTIAIDTGVPNGAVGAPSSSGRLAAAAIENMINADASDKHLLSVLGSQTAQASIWLRESDQFMTQPLCQNGSTVCSSGGVSLSVFSDTNQLPNGQTSQFVGPAGSYLIRYPVLFGQGYGETGPDWANEIPAPSTISVSGTGSGSLAAGTYCFVVVGVDSQATPGLTMPSPEVCQTVGASSSISLGWQVLRLNYLPNFRVYFGTAPAGENFYFTVTAVNSTNQTYTFNSTTGATSGSPAFTSIGTAYSSWVNDDAVSCLLCVPATAPTHQLGIGEPSPPSGDELAVKGGALDAESGFKGALSTKSSAYTLTTSDYWVNVTGTTTITVPHASTGNHWVVFNSGSNTVTVQADSGNVNGGASITLSANTGKEIACDGTNCFAH